MYYYNNELPSQQGWVCPKCGRANAPWMPTCGCVSSQTSGIPYLVKSTQKSRDSHEIAKDEPQTESSTMSEKPQLTVGVLFKGNLKEGDYKLIKTTDGRVLMGDGIGYAGWERNK